MNDKFLSKLNQKAHDEIILSLNDEAKLAIIDISETGKFGSKDFKSIRNAMRSFHTLCKVGLVSAGRNGGIIINKECEDAFQLLKSTNDYERLIKERIIKKIIE